MLNNLQSARTKMVLGNWKMNGNLSTNESLVARIVQGLKDLSPNSEYNRNLVLGVCVPFPYLYQVQAMLTDTPIHLGAQNVSEFLEGAYTGQVSAHMLTDFGCSYALVGHSECRLYNAETAQQVAKKADILLSQNIIPVVCFGETLQDRESNMTFDVITQQLEPIFDLGAQKLSRMVLAYEPVWAIGTGKTASPLQAQEVHEKIRSSLARLGCGDISILYGGSVKADNAGELFAMPDIDGGLIGGAALDSEAFLKIVAAMN